ncbi:MAG: single-stranded-DNA-specific exonuclease RecJ [Anaerolineales bacterium]|jgi:single-stranded-DNA-specific exonuclease
MEKIWKFPDPVPEGFLSDMEDFREIERQILYLRGLHDRDQATKFLEGEYAEGDDPFRILNMEVAAERILTAIDSREPIVIYADYDADGVSASALLYTGIRTLGGSVATYFPDRFTEGYGLNLTAVENLAREGCSLLITVDCGIRAYAEALRAKELGIDLIITDHHVPGESLPQNYALINPRQPDDEYPFKALAGVGVAYKLMQAVRRLRGVEDNPADLELVTIGTVADLVPLVGENRFLVRRGLELLNQTRHPGIQSLIEVSGHQSGSVNASAIGFGLGPRINAAGRLKTARLAFDLLVSKDLQSAKVLAEQLDRINRDRQEMMNAVVEQAFAAYEQLTTPGNVIVDFNKDYHEGVIGLAASKLTEALYRPAIVGSLSANYIVASARSIPGFHITRALEKATSILERFGGHSAAAGLKIKKDNIEMLQETLEKSFKEQMAGKILKPVLEIDGEAEFSELDDRMLRFHDKLAPFGVENQRPMLVTRNVRVLKKRTVGSDGSHLKLTLEQAGRPFDAIAFRMGERISALTPVIDVAFRLERNHYLGYVTLQLNVADFRPAT